MSSGGAGDGSPSMYGVQPRDKDPDDGVLCDEASSSHDDDGLLAVGTTVEKDDDDEGGKGVLLPADSSRDSQNASIGAQSNGYVHTFSCAMWHFFYGSQK